MGSASVLLVLGVILAQGQTLVQNGDTGPATGARLLALPRPGIPIAFDQIEERSHELPNGSYSVESVIHSKTYRDAAGRIRTDSEVQDGSGHTISTSSTVMDPTNGSGLILLEGERIAYRIAFPISTDSKLFSADALDETEPAHKWKTTSEEAGTSVIGGVAFSGRRVTQNAEDDPGLQRIFEYWNSDALKLTGAINISGLREKYMARIENLRRGEPDPALFQIPPGYKIVDMPPLFSAPKSGR